jgi:hypothetical protein
MEALIFLLRRAADRTALLLLLMLLFCCVPSRAGKKGEPLVIHLEPFGIPRALFGRGGPLLCLHRHTVGTRLFWLDNTHLFVAFTINAPCTFHSDAEPATLRGLVFDTTTGIKVAIRDWTVSEDLSVFAGPNHSVVLRDGSKIEFLNQQLKTTESGELDDIPKGLWPTPQRHTMALLSNDGRRYEFYGAGPMRLLDTISLDETDEVRAVKEWVAGDERIAGSYCADKSAYSCMKILVQTPDAKFLDRDGAPWSYQETEKPVSLEPIGFLDATHLIISREDKNFFHGPQMLIVTPSGARIQLPSLGSYYPRRIAGIAGDGARFGMEMYGLGACADCIVANFFVVAEPDARKFLFEHRGTPYMSAGELSPDGRWMAILDDNAVTMYPLPPMR